MSGKSRKRNVSSRFGRRSHSSKTASSRKRTGWSSRRGFEPLESRLMLDAGPLVISEFMADNENVLADKFGQYTDWIEIHNPTAGAINLDGWRLTDDAADLTQWRFPAVDLAAGGYLVVFASNNNLRDPADELHTNFALGRSGEYLALVQPDGVTVADSYTPVFPPQFDDISYGLSLDLMHEGYFPVPTPGLPNTTDQVDDPTRQVVISEIMYHPPTENDLEEYLELYSLGSDPVDLTGWQISDGVDFTFPTVTINPGEYLVVAADVATFTSLYPDVTNVVGGWTGALRNRGEQIEIVDSAGLRIDRVEYSDEGDWSVRERGPTSSRHNGWIWSDAHDGLGKSLELISPAMPNEYGQNWAASQPDGGTPGEVNSVDTDEIAPLILDVHHAPAIPRASDPVTVTARVIDELATGVTVTAYYRVDGRPNFTAIAMYDNGESGDGAASDGVYGAILPAQSHRTVVEFYVGASDTGDYSRTWPAPTQPSGEQRTNLLYQVDDSFDADATWVAGSQPIYHMIMTDSERAELAQIGSSGDSGSDAQMNATFISVDGAGVDGTGIEVRHNVGIRNRGNGSRRYPPNNYRVNFVNGEPWNDVIRLNINARYGYSQTMGSLLFRMAGIAAADASPVEARVNGVDLAETGTRMYGSYAHLEVTDTDFVDAHFPSDPDGNLYKVFGSGEFDWRGTNPDNYRNNYFKHTNEEEDDWSDLIQMVDVLNNTPNDAFVEELSQVIDIDQWLRFLATDALLGNREGGLTTGRGDDFAIYRGVEDPRFVLVPHDLDTILGQGGVSPDPNRSIFVYEGVTGLNRLLNHPDILPRYFRAFGELIDEFYNPETLNPIFDQVLGGYVPQDRINGMKQFVVNRTAGVLAQIPRGYSINSNLPDIGGVLRTTAYTSAFNGTADATAQSILIGGQLASWAPRAARWSIGSQVSGGSQMLLARGSEWSYLDDGTDQGTAWREPSFDDSTWASGPAQLGFGDGDEATIVSYGDDPNAKYPTTYFRRTFEAQDVSSMTTLVLRLLRDDGAIVYLNGIEIQRDNMPDGEITYGSYAMASGSATENAYHEWTLDPAVWSNLLFEGTNVLAVEVHQATAASSDLGLDLELEAFLPPRMTGVPLKRGINRVLFEAFDGPGGTGNLLHQEYIDVWCDVPPSTTNQHLDLTVRDSYLPGTPFLVRAEVLDQYGKTDRDLWDAVVTLSTDDPGVVLSTDQVRLYNGLGSTLVTATGGDDFTLTASLGELEVGRVLVGLENEPVAEISGTLPGTETTLSGVVHVTGDLLVPDGHTLTIEPGTLILIDGVESGSSGIDIDVEGTIQSLGTATQPVTFTAYDSAQFWGEIHHANADPSLYQYTHITRAGNSPTGGHTGTGPMFRPTNSTITFDHVAMTDSAGKIMQANGSDLTFTDSHLARAIMGPEISGTALLMEGTWITEMFGPDDDDGIYIHGQQAGQDVTLRGGVIADGDDDALDTLGSTVTIESYIFRDFADKGMSIYGGEMHLSDILSVNNDIGISLKDRGTANPRVYLDHATIVGNNIGVEVNDKYGEPNVQAEYFITNSIVWNNTTTFRTDYDPADIHVDYSNTEELWPGTGNLNVDPMLVDTAIGDFHLQAGSLSIDAGDPASALDSDGTRADQGFYHPGERQQTVSSEIPAGTITENLVLAPAGGPYRILGDVTVAAGATLTILPGTNVFFEPDTSIIINGRLIAEGTEDDLIWFTRVPGPGSWDGLQFRNTMEDNRISYAILEYATTSAGMVGVENSNLTLDHVTLDHAERRRIRVEDSSLIVRNSTFTDMFPPGQAPLTDNGSEQIWGGHFPAGGHFIIENNVFGTTPGHNDVIDVDGEVRATGGVVMQILNNTFLGGGDDALDIEGDAHIEGNTFMHFRKDQWNTGTGDANIISAGGGHEFTVVGNFFYDVDHIAQVKDGSYMTLVNNTLVDCAVSAVYFVRPGGTSGPGRGAYVDGNIFAGTATVFDEVEPTTDLVAHRNIMPAAYHVYGIGNIDEDPRVADPAGGDFSLLPGSPAIGAGINGLDMGAMVPGGPSLSGIPTAITTATDATIAVDGPGVTDYKYRLNDDPWSDATPVDQPIQLSGLADGDYTLYVLGQNTARAWQDEADATVSPTWTVDAVRAHLRINEVLARNTAAMDHEGTFPDVIELANVGAAPIDLAGMAISDEMNDPTPFIFPANTVIQPGGYLVLFADDETETSGLHLGFSLDGDGEGVYLFDSSAIDRDVLDSVEFGPQVVDLSIGRIGHDAQWGLTQPTLGTENIAQQTGNPATLRINEWLASEQVRFVDDFVELYNPDHLPVPLAGLHLTDNPVNEPELHEIGPLSFVAGNGAVALKADGQPDDGGNHVDFKLSSKQEMLALYDADLNVLDRVAYYWQTTDVSQGRSPDGSDTWQFFRLPTPGLRNQTAVVTHLDLATWGTSWSYDDSATDLGTAWREVDFAEAGWKSGPGPLGWEDSALPVPLATQVDSSTAANTYYFRTYFNLAGDPAGLDLQMTTLLDDGAVFYINGQEVLRVGMDAGTVDYDTLSNRSVVQAEIEGPFSIPADVLVQGDNVLAVEVHQNGSGNPDIVLGVTLDGTTVWRDDLTAGGLALLDGLRITELMYHPDNEDLEFVELRNIGTESLNLEGVRFTDGIDFTFPAMVLPAGEYVVIVRDMKAFTEYYGQYYGTGINVAGDYSGGLDNGGEQLTLKLPEPLDAAVLRFEYNDSWYPMTDGGGYSLVMADPATPVGRFSDAERWQVGTDIDGSPGRADGQLVTPSVVINEVLTHTDLPQVDTIELYNPTNAEINIGGWYLSDSKANFLKYQIPAGTSLLPGEYTTFDETHFNPTPITPAENDFALDGAHGDDVWLVRADGNGAITRFVDYVAFPAAANGESFGRWPNGTGGLYPMDELTLGAENTGPRVGPVVISEVMYNPPAPGAGIGQDDLEYVEIFNTSSATVDLAHWRVDGGIDFEFPSGTSLSSGQSLLVVPFDVANAATVAAFRAHYGLSGSVTVVGDYDGRLGNSGEMVRLLRADEPPAGEAGFYPMLLEDQLTYDDAAPWPLTADGSGDSLHRIEPGLWGPEVASWTALAPTPGFVDAQVTAVVNRAIFYNNSSFDTLVPPSEADDDLAIAPDKQALMPGQTASWANYTSYLRGINGIMIDVMALGNKDDLDVADFQFRTGNSNNSSAWADGPLPESVTVRAGAGTNDSDRVTLIWADGAIRQQWLQVTVLDTDNTGLSAPDVFYFGNAIGEAGDSTRHALVNATDEIYARNNQHGPFDQAASDDPYDFNRDRLVNAMDQIIARSSQTSPFSALRLISVPMDLDEPVPQPAPMLAAADAVLAEDPIELTGKLAWVRELESLAEARQAENDTPSESAIDLLLASYWQ